jgi:Cytochrome P450
MDGANVRFCVSRGGFIGTTVSPCARPRSTLRRLSEQIGRYAYLPFGAGPRICIGAAFALQEATLVLAAIAKNFRLLLAPGATVWPLQRVTLRPTGGLPMVLARDALRAEVKPRHGLKTFAMGALDEQIGSRHPVPSPMPALASAAGSAKEWQRANFRGNMPPANHRANADQSHRPTELLGPWAIDGLTPLRVPLVDGQRPGRARVTNPMVKQATRTRDLQRQERLWSERMAADHDVISDIVDLVLRSRMELTQSPALVPRADEPRNPM